MLGDTTISMEQRKNWVWAEIAKVHPEIKRKNFPVDDPFMFLEIIVNNTYRYRALPGDHVMDIGANIGVFTALCALNGAEVVAYEPHPEAFRVLQETIDRNKIGGLVLPFNEAIQVRSGFCKYLPSTSHPGNHETDRVWTSYNGAVRDGENLTRCMGFDDAVMNHDWDCVKMDIEGAEFEILMAASDEALKRIKFLTLEIHNGWADKVTYDALVQRLLKVFALTGIQDGDPRFADENRFISVYGTRK